MRSKIGLLIGLSTALLLFLSTYGISSVNGEPTYLKNSSFDNKSSDANSAIQTNLDPFMLRGSDGTVNTGSSDDAPLTDDGSTSSSDDGSTSSSDDGSTSSSDDGSTSSSDDGSTSSSDDGSTSSSDDDSDNNKSEQDNKDSESSDDDKYKLPFP